MNQDNKKTPQNKSVSEAVKREDPRIKSIQQSCVRIATSISMRIRTSDDAAQIGKLNAALNLVNMALLIVQNDSMRASQLLSSARGLMSVGTKPQAKG